MIPTLARYKFDLVFLDAVKSEHLQYLKLIEENNLMKVNSVVVADNGAVRMFLHKFGRLCIRVGNI